MKQTVMDKVAKTKLVPVIKLDNAAHAVPLGEALVKGGLPIAEVTFRTSAAAEAIRAMKKIPDMLVGAGTVTNLEQAQKALDAGAEFIVTPGFSRKVTEFAINNKLPVFPGICTPTELMMLMEYELPIAKFFPAMQYGGISTIKALSAPFPRMMFMPTGGIGPDNVLDYLKIPQVVACGGSWMAKDSLINANDFDEIEKLTRQAVAIVKQ